LSRFNGDQKVLVRFLRLFRERNATTVSDIGAAMERNDLEAARRSIHTFKGAAGTIGMIGLQAAAARLEKTLAAALKSPGPDNPSSSSQADFAALEASWKQAQDIMTAMLDVPASTT
jgi:HPt (histidine-containing phosphotransfer) domain-containing protein